ncbi:MAG: hypothetical protein PV354_09840, partial [Bartonella sp.]|nr:hypothetical protein [Bartonella sp.]
YLNEECSNFIIKVNSRLSLCELKALNEKNYKQLAESISISESKAKKIMIAYGGVKELQNKMQVLRANRVFAVQPKVMAC